MRVYWPYIPWLFNGFCRAYLKTLQPPPKPLQPNSSESLCSVVSTACLLFWTEEQSDDLKIGQHTNRLSCCGDRTQHCSQLKAKCNESLIFAVNRYGDACIAAYRIRGSPDPQCLLRRRLPCFSRASLGQVSAGSRYHREHRSALQDRSNSRF